jgi:hypothetical protein
MYGLAPENSEPQATALKGQEAVTTNIIVRQ